MSTVESPALVAETALAAETEPVRVVESPALVASGDAVSVWASSVLVAEHGPDPLVDALYVATTEAGAQESLAFWAAARATGFAFAAPGAFPYTLANAPAGRIATALGIRGPSVTLLGSFADARSAAADDLADGLCTRPLVLHLDPTTRTTTLPAPPTPWRLTSTILTLEGPPSAGR